MVTIRESIPESDCARICEIQNQFDPEPLVAESYLEKMKKIPEGWSVKRLTAEDGGEVVGFAHLRRNSGMHRGTFLLTIGVDEERQGQGIGAALMDGVTGVIPEMGVDKIVPMVRETHPRGERFFRDRGFGLVLSLRESFLDLSAFADQGFGLPEGYRLVRWSEIEDNEANREKFATAFLKMDADEPGTQLLGGFDRTSIERDAFDPECSDPDSLYLIEFGGEWVAHHQVVRNEPGTWETANITFTGTLPEHRRKGLATHLKNLGAAEAKARGAKRILTHNDSSNAAMLAINRKQGYIEEPGWLLMVKEL